ncbi:MFS glucose transporter [Rhodotorula toruloides]|uniref:MFS glucose transporter n=1 Tax=Rhodotorula toruloides TaxID=5286 RepID=A0A511KJX8_RHOTO|nr:MFS glucose transporter [Rhodotorula toruloides]
MAPPPKRSLVTRFTTNNYVAGMLPTLAGFMCSFGGALINSYLSDKIGRKWCIIISGWVWVLGCIIQAASFNVRTLVAGRVVAGLAVGLGSAIVTIYQAEITRPAIRGRIVATQQLAITFSELLQFFVSFGCSYIANDASFRMPWALQAIPGLILGILMFAFPESPRWLMDRGREDAALQILADVHAEGDTENDLVQLEYLEIKRQVEFDRTLAARSYLDLLKPEYFRRTFLACITQMWSQLSGNNVMMYYIVYVFQSAGLVGRRGGLIASGVQYSLHFVATIPAVLYVDAWGRRPTMMIGMFAMGCCLFAVGAIQATLGQPLHSGSSATTTWTIVGHTSARNAVIVLSYIFVMLFSMTYGPCSWIFPSEIHHMRVRGKAVSAATATNWIFNFALAWSTPPAFRNIQYKTYFVYGTFCICAALNVFFMFPETKGRTLEEMDDLFAAGHAFSAWRLSSVPKKTLAEVEAEVAESDMRSEGDHKHTMNHIEKSSSDRVEQAARQV